MALKYQTNFTDLYGNLYRVEILNDQYHGPVKDLELGPEAVVISRPKKKITDPLFSMGATIQVWSNDNFEYADLFSTGEQTNQVLIGCNDQVIFRGWIDPNLYEEDYMAPPYLISIPATDGLVALENYFPDGLDGKQPITLLTLIRKCLSYTGMNLPVNIACGLNPNLRTDNRLFEHCCVELESLRTFKDGVYEYDNVLKLLEDLLRPFSCRIYQSNDEWYIERIKDRVPVAANWIRYTSETESTQVLKEITAALDSPEYPFVDNAASLQIDAGYGKQTIKADGDTWETVIMNNFADRMVKLPLDTSLWLYPFIGYDKTWLVYGEGFDVKPFSTFGIIEQGAELLHAGIVGKHRLWQTTRITANYQDEIKISFKLTIIPGSKAASRFKVSLQSYIKRDVSTELFVLNWVKGDNDKTFYLSESDPSIGPDHRSEGIYTVEENWKKGFSTPIEISITAKLGKSFGAYDFKQLSFAVLPVKAEKEKDIWVDDYEYIESTLIGDIEVKVVEKNKYDNTFTGIINRRQLREAEDLDVRFWTLPSKYTGQRRTVNYNFKNGLINPDYTAIDGITCPAEGKKDYITSVVERLLIDNFDQYYDPRDLLSGTVQTDVYLSPERHYTIATRLGKTFLMTGLEASLRNSLYEVSLEEIKPNQIIANIR